MLSCFDLVWLSRLPESRKETRWLNILKILVSYRLIAPGSEWCLHRHRYGNIAIADLSGEAPEVITKINCINAIILPSFWNGDPVRLRERERFI